MQMKRSHVIILCAATLSSLVGGAVHALNRGNGFITTCSASTVDIMVSSTFRITLLRYKKDCGRFPTTDEGLHALLQPPDGQTNWKGPYLDGRPDRNILDPWNRPYRYVSPGIKNPEFYDLWSEGPDPKSSHDDIVNWPR